MTSENIKVTKPRVKAITQEDLAAFKEEINELLDERLSTFVDDFFEAWDEANSSDEPSETDDKCTCDECKSMENFDPEKIPRYVINAGGQTYHANEICPNPLYGIDYFLIEEINGKEYHQKGTIMSSDITIIDLRPSVDLETFTNIKQSMIGHAIEKVQEAKANEEAAASKKQTEVPKDINVNHMLYG